MPYLEGKDVARYEINFKKKYLQYDQSVMSRPTFPELHHMPKIIIRAISAGLDSTFDNQSYYIDQKLIICSHRNQITEFIKTGKRPTSKLYLNSHKIHESAVVAIINSKLSKFYYLKAIKRGISVMPEDVRNYPLLKYCSEYQELSNKASTIISNKKTLNQIIMVLLNLIKSNFDLNKFSKRLSSWHLLTFREFKGELKKQKIKLSLSDEAEWIQHFEEQKSKALDIENQIEQIDLEIDQMVYELYGLSEEEIRIVEEATT
jgi:hypothetical protein